MYYRYPGSSVKKPHLDNNDYTYRYIFLFNNTILIALKKKNIYIVLLLLPIVMSEILLYYITSQ